MAFKLGTVVRITHIPSEEEDMNESWDSDFGRYVGCDGHVLATHNDGDVFVRMFGEDEGIWYTSAILRAMPDSPHAISALQMGERGIGISAGIVVRVCSPLPQIEPEVRGGPDDAVGCVGWVSHDGYSYAHVYCIGADGMESEYEYDTVLLAALTADPVTRSEWRQLRELWHRNS